MSVAPLRLRPGLHTVRRDDGHLQIGLDPPWRLVVPDRPEVRTLLEDLVQGRCCVPGTDLTRRVLDDLVAADLVHEPVPIARPPVCVLGTDTLVAEAVRLLHEADVALVEDDHAAAVLILSDGEPVRAVVDEQMRAGQVHLVVSGTPTGYRIGPFVRPGLTACLRCVDAHRGERDPRRAVVIEQLAGRPLAPPDPVLRTLVAAWAVRELTRYLDGTTPLTWSAEVTVGEDPGRRTPWTRHPHCGCTWADDLAG